MKIALLNIYSGITERGSEIFVKEFTRRLAEKNQISVFQTGQEQNKYNYRIFTIKGIPYKPFGKLYDFWVLIFTIKCLPFLLDGKFDWIIPINGRWQTLLCRILRFFCRYKILISGHAGIGFEDRLNIVLGKPDLFVALTPNAYNWAKKINKVKVEYIPNGVNTEKFNTTVKPVKLVFEKPIILCVSAFLPYKRIDLLIKAVALLPNKVNLIIIGDGPLRNHLINLGEKLLPGRYFLAASVPYQKINAYYRAASVFSLPSKESEAFGLVYLEAMACNLPVVAPDDVNRRNIIGEGGMFADPQDVKGYASVLEKALKSDFADRPRKQAEKYSWELICRQYQKVLDEN